MKTLPFILREGFWAGGSEPGSNLLPRPITAEKAWKGKRVFLKALTYIEQSTQVHAEHYKDWSTCRVCEMINGSQDFRFESMNITWKWPSGYTHYVKIHNVRPSLAFQEFITLAYELMRSPLGKIENQKIKKSKN